MKHLFSLVTLLIVCAPLSSFANGNAKVENCRAVAAKAANALYKINEGKLGKIQSNKWVSHEVSEDATIDTFDVAIDVSTPYRMVMVENPGDGPCMVFGFSMPYAN